MFPWPPKTTTTIEISLGNKRRMPESRTKALKHLFSSSRREQVVSSSNCQPVLFFYFAMTDSEWVNRIHGGNLICSLLDGKCRKILSALKNTVMFKENPKTTNFNEQTSPSDYLGFCEFGFSTKNRPRSATYILTILRRNPPSDHSGPTKLVVENYSESSSFACLARMLVPLWIE